MARFQLVSYDTNIAASSKLVRTSPAVQLFMRPSQKMLLNFPRSGHWELIENYHVHNFPDQIGREQLASLIHDRCLDIDRGRSHRTRLD